MYFCKGRCVELRKKLCKVPKIGSIERRYWPEGTRRGCTVCDTSFFTPMEFPGNRCLCCHALLRTKPHSGERKRKERLLLVA